MFTIRGHESSNHNREAFLKRKRILRVREILDGLGDNKHQATPQLIMEALNKDGDNVCLADAANILRDTLPKAAAATTNSPYSRFLPSTAIYQWQTDRVRRLKYVVWKLGGVDRARPDEILEAMRINHDNDYYLTVDDVRYNLNAHRHYLGQTGSCFRGPRRLILESMWPAPLVDDCDSLSEKMDAQLFLGENKSEKKTSSDQPGGSGGPMRRALRRGGDRINSSNRPYEKKIDHMVTDLRRLTIGPN